MHEKTKSKLAFMTAVGLSRAGVLPRISRTMDLANMRRDGVKSLAAAAFWLAC
jgi:hypothetical protein